MKSTCQVFAAVGDFIDIFSAPSRDPRVNNKFKKNIIQNYVVDLLSLLLQQIDENSDCTS